jgi:ABC-type transporter MlaC component
VYLLSNIAENVNPLAALRSQREKDKAKSRQKVVRDHLEVIATTRDPLRPVKREWSKLSPRQQDEFFRWAKTQLRATGRDPK